MQNGNNLLSKHVRVCQSSFLAIFSLIINGLVDDPFQYKSMISGPFTVVFNYNQAFMRPFCMPALINST